MEPILHIIIPLLILLALFPKLDKKLVIGLSLLAILPDFDSLLPLIHRVHLHNIFFAVIIPSTIYLFYRNIKVFLISLYYLLSHLILDLTFGGVAIFYPLYQKLIEITISLNTNWLFIFNIKTHELSTATGYGEPHYFFTKISIMVLLIVIIMLIIKFRKKLIK